MPPDETRARPPAFTRPDAGGDDETWRALPQWRSVPSLRLGPDPDEVRGHRAGPSPKFLSGRVGGPTIR